MFNPNSTTARGRPLDLASGWTSPTTNESTSSSSDRHRQHLSPSNPQHSSSSNQQHSSYLQPGHSYHGTLAQSLTSTTTPVRTSTVNANPAFGHPAPTQHLNHSSFGRSQPGTSHVAHPPGAYHSLQPPVQGYAASSSGRQNTSHAQAQQTSYTAQQASTSSQAQFASTQLKALIRVVRDLSQDLHLDGFDEADPKGICQALNELRECLAAAEETQQNVQLFVKLRAIIAKLNDGLAYLTDTTSPIQASRNKSVLKIAGILGVLTDSKTGPPCLFAESGDEQRRTNAMITKLENLVNAMASQARPGAPTAPAPASFSIKARTKINLRGSEIKLGDASRPNADNSIGCFNQMSEGSSLEVHAPGFKLSAPSGALWSRNIIGAGDDPTGTGSAQGLQQMIRQGIQRGWNLQP